MALNIAEIVVSVALIAVVLLQERSAGAGGLFGGGSGASYQTRRGFERIIYWATLVLAFIFGALAVANLLVR